MTLEFHTEAVADVADLARGRAWVHHALATLAREAARSADTHLLRLNFRGFDGIDFYFKDEAAHPTGSLKHRLARSLFLYALCNGRLQQGQGVVDASSGSTAISEAWFARLLGMPFTAVMPACTAPRKIHDVQALGGTCDLVDDPAQVHALVALLGVIGAAIGTIALGIAGAGIVLLVWASYRRTRSSDPGLTSEVALLLTFLLGALAAQHAQLAAALFVATVIVLASKQSLHRFTRELLTDAELNDLLLLAASAVIVLPLLPDRVIDPFGVLNPRKLWLLVVLVMTINAAGHVALRLFGAWRGLLLAGFLGGFVSSTATIGGMGQRAAAMPQLRRSAVAAALLSNIPTVIQIAIILAALAPALLRAVAPALAAAGCIAIVVAGAFVRRARDVPAPPPAAMTRPFDFGHGRGARRIGFDQEFDRG